MKPNGKESLNEAKTAGGFVVMAYLSSHKLSKVLSLNKLFLGHAGILFNWLFFFFFFYSILLSFYTALILHLSKTYKT